MLTTTLAKRFLLSKTSDGFLSLIAWVSIVGVMLGVVALIVVTSVINGFEGELKRAITGMNGEVLLYTRGTPVRHGEEIETKIRKILPSTQAITHSFVTELMLSGPSGVSGAILEGFDEKTLGEVTEVPRRLEAGQLPKEAGEVALGVSLAQKIGVKLGGTLRIIAPFASAGNTVDGEVGMGAPRATEAKVVGLIRMGMHQYDSKFVFAPLAFVQTFLGQPDRLTTFKVKLGTGRGAGARVDEKRASQMLKDNFGYPFRAKYWGELNRNLFIAIELEKVVIAIILTAIILVAAFNVVSTLMMMIHDKTKEIAILKAMGFRPSQSFFLFCLIGLGIGVVGTGGGFILGMLLNLILMNFRLIDLPSDIYYISYLPVVMRWEEIGMILFFAFLICLAATLYPAWQVSRRAPLSGLRYE